MAERIEAPRGEVRVVFRSDEVQQFLHGREPVPGYGGDDALNVELQAAYDALNDAFPDVGQFVRPFVEPAPWVRAAGLHWYVVNFRFAHGPVLRTGHDPEAVADWIAEQTPDFLFAVQDEDGRPVRLVVPRERTPSS